MLIEGLSPEVYASYWGHTYTEDGIMFYNFSSEKHEKDTEWYKAFIQAIDRQIEKIKQNPQHYNNDDADNLRKLREYVETLAF